MSACGGKQGFGTDKKPGENIGTESLLTPVDILPGITSVEVDEDLREFPLSSLRLMLKTSESREEYIRGLYANKKLKKIASEKGFDKDKRLKLQIDASINKIYKDILIGEFFKIREKDLAVLAKDKYETNKEKYITRRKIMIAQIYLSKINRSLEDTKSILKEVKDSLDSGQDFFEIAEKYNEDKLYASKGGVYSKWLIEPIGGRLPNKILGAAFGLEKVGDISEVVESKHGFHIIRLVNNASSIQRPFSEVRDGIINKLKGELLSTVKEDVDKSLYPPEDVKPNDSELRKIILDALKKRNDEVAK